MTVRNLEPSFVYGSKEHTFEGKVRFERWHLGSGTTRHVYRVGKYAVKIPNLTKRPTRWRGMFLRGMLANRSEWKQRKREDVLSPVFTLFWVIQAYPCVTPLPHDTWDRWNATMGRVLEEQGVRYDERKPSSWGSYVGLTGMIETKLIDYDRCWDEPMGWLGKYQEWRDEHIYSFEQRGWIRNPFLP